MSKTMSKKKLAIIMLCICFIMVGGLFGVRAFMGANADQVDSNNTVISEYSDYEYEGANVVDIDSKSVQDILKCYEKDNLSLKVDDDYTIGYTISSGMKDNVVNVEAAVCMEKSYESDAGDQEKAILYIGSTDDCDYNKDTGNVTSEYDFKGLVLNDEQPLATYFVSEDDKGGIYHTPVYLDESEEAVMLVVGVDNDGKVTVEGQLVDKDEDGNKLEETKVVPLKSGTVIWPAYENYIVKQATIDETCIEASEVYDEEESYVYGTDYNLTFTDIPDGKYLYNYKFEYSGNDVAATSEDVPQYCVYTDQQEVEVKDDEVAAVNKVKLEEICVEDYKTLSIKSFLKYVKNNRKNLSDEDKYQLYEHKVEGYDILKGYISTWNSLEINRAMRTDTIDKLCDDDKKTVDVLTKNCMNNQFDEDLLAIRNVSADFLTTIFGTQLNGENLTDDMLKKGGDKVCLELEKELQKDIIGKTIVEKGFMSVSLVPAVNIVFGRKVRLMIMIPKGTKAYVTHNVFESEAILPPNSNLIVKDVTYNKFRNRFEVYCLAEQNF